ncbi:hypothetical protein [Nostoc sp. UHCC 0870]|uniref:hypothetical protein n=1 Tax=Nostoc sp. UHCC 0870 TaxID=2914041 RepID=UPI001EDD056E|nr:hypothetical protein [Nostoc sp. UHCC 0870]UKP01467.1 hypothetical protein L6494_29965 [Nostoc sp. UHCC 0870]
MQSIKKAGCDRLFLKEAERLLDPTCGSGAIAYGGRVRRSSYFCPADGTVSRRD